MFPSFSHRATAGHVASIVGTFTIGCALIASPTLADADAPLYEKVPETPAATEQPEAEAAQVPADEGQAPDPTVEPGLSPDLQEEGPETDGASDQPQEHPAENEDEPQEVPAPNPTDDQETAGSDPQEPPTNGDAPADGTDDGNPQEHPDDLPDGDVPANDDRQETPSDPSDPSDPTEDDGHAPAAPEASDAAEAKPSHVVNVAPTPAPLPIEAEKPAGPAVDAAPAEKATAAPQSSPVVTIKLNDQTGMATMVAQGGAFDRAWGVSFMVTGPNGTRWIGAKHQADGSWTASLSATELGTGSTTVQGWANVGSEPAASHGSASMRISGPSAALGLSYDPASRKLVLSARDVSCPSGVTFVSAGVQSPGGATRWYRLTSQGDGTWSAEIDPSAFRWEAGSYRIIGSICDRSWAGIPTGTSSSSVSYGQESLTATPSAEGDTVTIKASGGRFEAAWGVSFAVTKGDATTWLAAQRQADGSWKATVSSAHLGSGSLTASAWANIDVSGPVQLATASANVPAAKATLSLTFDEGSQRLKVRATDVVCPSGVAFISVGVTAPSGTTSWHRLDRQSDGSWSVLVDPAAFSWQTGTYSLVGSICDAKWNGIQAGTKTVTLSYGKESLTANASENRTKLSATAQGGRYRDAWNVSFEIAGPSATTWVAGTRQSDGSWVVNAPASTWGGGKLTVTAYANIGSSTVRLGSAQVLAHSLSPELACSMQPSKDSVLATASGGTFDTASNVAFAVYNIYEGESSTAWFQAVKQSDGSWTCTIPAAVNGVGTCAVSAWATSDSSTSLVKSTRYTYSVAPSIVGQVELGGGDYSLSYGMAGLKVQRVQQALGIGDFNYPRYLDETEAAVKRFQSRVGLSATGIVNRATWLSLGLDENEWYTLGAYASPVRVSSNASASERVEAMIGRARDYLGDPYVWDASGAPGQGVDCAGLVMQSLYAAGLSTGIINPVTHSTTAWGDHDALNYYNYGGFTKTSLADRVRGNLIFYRYGSSVDHIAIYLGNDEIIEAYPGRVQISSLWKATIAGVARVF